MTEKKLVEYASSIVGGSFIVTGLFIVALFGLPLMFSSDFNLLDSPFAMKVIIISCLYILSLYLLVTLPEKKYKRRLFSWAFSIVFHSTLLIYLSVALNVGDSIFFFGIVETGVLLLSIWGIILSFLHEKHNKSFKSEMQKSDTT